MTEAQYETYSKLKDEIKSVKLFLECGCGCTYNNLSQQFPFSMIVQERCERKIKLLRKWYACGHDENVFDIPKSLQMEIVRVAEQWLSEKKKELERI